MKHRTGVPRMPVTAPREAEDLGRAVGMGLPMASAQPSAQTVLVASTCWWAFPARIAMAFASAGFQVAAICPRGHPLRVTRAVRRNYLYRAFDPVSALASAIDDCNPELVLPCDDRAVSHMHALHARLLASDNARAGLIERSIGGKGSFAATTTRSELIRIAREEGIRAPEMQRVQTVGELQLALTQLGLPAVMKLDGSWGGLGVVVVHSAAQAETVFHAMSQPLRASRALKRLIVNRDAFSVLPWLNGTRPTVNVQQFVPGRPANCAAACWMGELLAISCVEVLRAQSLLGASTVVRVIDNRQMVDATERLVRRLRLSGFCGLDFQIDGDGNVHLLELNARSTPLCHLPVGGGHNPLGALAERIAGTPVASGVPEIAERTIAFFPQAWMLQPDTVFLQSGYHDVPWQEPELVQELLRLPWPERSVLARLSTRLRRKPRAPMGCFD